MADAPPILVLTDLVVGDSPRVAVIRVPGRPPSSAVTDQLMDHFGPALAAVAREPDMAAPDPHLVVDAADDSPEALRAAGAQVGRAAGTDDPLICLVPAHGSVEVAAGIVLGTQNLVGDPGQVELVAPNPGAVEPIERGARVATAVLMARRLANTPSDIKSPTWLADQAAAVSRVPTVAHGPDWLMPRGFGGILAVGAGSAHDPNLTVLQYRGSDAGPHVVLVGKGITFDSGGLSLKPPPAMPLMKTDMSGAAAVIGAITAVRELRLPVRVTGVLACAENMPSGSAMRPGDVVRHYGGRTTEIRNTDAEGRLVLADALAWAADTLAPDVMIDLATLTGAATVGLGRQHAALYSNDDRLARQLALAGQRSGDAVWRMPLVSAYESAIASDIADSANSNTDATTQAGSITAALFLQPFAGKAPWAHLDIAGVGRTESDRPDCRKGGTGFGVSLLVAWLSRLAR